MKFSHDQLDDLVFVKKPIECGIEGTRRWSVDRWAIFQFEGKYYRFDYSVGATEQQDQGPFDGLDDPHECPEVEPRMEMVKVWKEKDGA